ncbi:putative transcriptional regulator YdhM [Shimwellia blattae DSM 4481 = NBRC 105725]|uniref:Putative transcriptional regulator YdhM n=2 Tax=Shimwellia blattae TaxID=563 RepID=I2BA24_SHIBC|nr:putative transcriptional regulator YdhM [Shimwellia blattae DSM 4481 = NBRC 105725]VDY64875.1 HTH-type transcriptional repressor nemR [Shimwellia blattae]VEC23026.1 HTH-type transcriptional repressor nemR [Shimwellia blattae]
MGLLALDRTVYYCSLMNKHSENSTREQLLITGEQLSLRKGFNAMGLTELLQTAKIPKGSFYHYFRSKEAFGVAMLEYHYAGYYRLLSQHFASGAGNYRDRLLDYFRASLRQFRNSGMISGCLTVKLSAEVCDLSEDMRHQMEQGISQITALLTGAIEQAVAEGSLAATPDAGQLASALYSLWLGANLQAKIAHHAGALESALSQVEQILQQPA